MALWLRTLADVTGALSSILNTQVPFHNSSETPAPGIGCPLLAFAGTACTWYGNMLTDKNTHTQK